MSGGQQVAADPIAADVQMREQAARELLARRESARRDAAMAMIGMWASAWPVGVASAAKAGRQGNGQ